MSAHADHLHITVDEAARWRSDGVISAADARRMLGYAPEDVRVTTDLWGAYIADGIDAAGGTVVTDTRHDEDCEGWLPEGVCTCVPWIIVAPTAQRALAHLARVGRGRSDRDFRKRSLIVHNVASAQRLRGLRNDGRWHLEILDYPERPHDTTAIQQGLLLMGWPPEEVY